MGLSISIGQRIPVLNQPTVDIQVAEIARRQHSFIAGAGVPTTCQARDANFVNEGVCRDVSTRVRFLLCIEAPLRGFRGIKTP